MNNITKAITEIRQIFESRGDEEYFGEPVSQYEHAAQTAILAKNAGFNEEIQIASFLHDIGHLLPAKAEEELMEIFGRKDHEGVASDWLRTKNFSEKIVILVENHVNAKRYLCYIDENYYIKLSDASKKTLAFQGGPMSKAEAETFVQTPYFELIILMRMWDETAKIEGQVLPNLSYFLELCKQHLLVQHHTFTNQGITF